MTYTRNLHTMELLAEIDEYHNGNVEHFKTWTVEELVQHLLANYPCSRYCAKQAAHWLSCGIIPEKAIDIKYNQDVDYKRRVTI
jgi:hypothetical protein